MPKALGAPEWNHPFDTQKLTLIGRCALAPSLPHDFSEAFHHRVFSIVPVAAQLTQLRICRSKTIWAVRFRLLPQSNVHTEVQERVGLTLSDRKVII